MVAVYVRLINAGYMQVNDVPILWREQVRNALKEE